MLEALLGPWPWYVSGPLIGLTVPLLLLVAGKALGISGGFQAMCDLASPRARKAGAASGKETWKVVFGLGILLGGLIAARFLSAAPLDLLPDSFLSVRGVLQLLLGGFLVGFGSRYAEGCTSGHAIFGLSSFQAGSLVAVLGFFAGGLGMAALNLLLF